MKQQMSFKEELRKSLINHALIPFICAIFVIIVVITVIGFGIISKKNGEAASQFTEDFSDLLETYSEEAEAISQRLSMEAFETDTKYRVDELAEIYHFLNRQDVRGEFYLFDKDFSLLYATEEDLVMQGYLYHYLKSNKNDSGFWEKSEFMYDNWNLKKETSPSCVIFREVLSEGEVKGYSGFVLSADRFKVESDDQNMSLIITNRFQRVFSDGADIFCNERGKLLNEFKENGLFRMKYGWYHVTPEMSYNGQIHIYAVTDCTVFLQLILISSVIFLLLSVIMIYFIYVSAGTIAKRKTDIMYELIEALEDVERGNLNVELHIQSGDEFEKMGNTFNMMLESIRDLISRQQQLTKENTIATIQTLESQFNPHFLFNTLESIRYMIRANASTAEKMIVNLSRLLRYSIQKSEKMVILAEEIEFVDKYLQIMLCRYGERLRYTIDIEEQFHEVEVPRMIIQPLVENSIKYGYGEKKTLNVRITSHACVDGVEIVISDDGKGIEPELLAEVRENLKHNHNYSGHIGIHNVHRRLNLIYGDTYGLTIESTVGSGTEVRLHLPDLESLEEESCY